MRTAWIALIAGLADSLTWAVYPAAVRATDLGPIVHPLAGFPFAVVALKLAVVGLLAILATVAHRERFPWVERIAAGGGAVVAGLWAFGAAVNVAYGWR